MKPFALLIAASLLVPPQVSSGEPPLSWAKAVSGQIKIRPGAPLTQSSGTASLIAAQGECEGFQIAAPPGTEAKLEALPLKNAAAGTAAPLKLRAYREAFVPVKTPSNSRGATGLWPDPLIPLDDPDFVGFKLPVDNPDAPYVAYLELCVPAEQAAGTYRGSVRMTAPDRRPATIEVTAEVLPFRIPATSSLANSFGLSLFSVAKGHGLSPESPEAKALLHRYAEVLLRHRISAQGMSMEPVPFRMAGGKIALDFRAFDAELGDFLSGKALSAAQGGAQGGPQAGARFTSVEIKENKKLTQPEDRTEYWKQIRQHFKDKGWTQTLFYYAKDEPKAKDYPLVVEQSTRVRSAQGVPVLITSHFEPTMAKAADILCPNLNCFFERPGPQTCYSVQTVEALKHKLGPDAHIWWYQSCNSHGCSGGPTTKPDIEQAYTGWASYMVDHSALSNRAMGSLAFLSGVEGELYFDTVSAFHDLNPWSGVFEFGGNGDGTLFYPGTARLTGQKREAPVESLRLKQIRDGLEDYEYLKLLAERGKSDLAQSLVKRWTKSGYEITEDPVKWAAVRQEAADALKAGSLKTERIPASTRP